jgi:hypothetical protein
MTAATVRYMPRYCWLNMDRLELTWEALMPRNARDQAGGDRHRGHRGVLLHRYGGSSYRAGQLTCK